jgi:hypothetical protein
MYSSPLNMFAIHIYELLKPLLPLSLFLRQVVAQPNERGITSSRIQSAPESTLVCIELLTLAPPVQRNDFVL